MFTYILHRLERKIRGYITLPTRVKRRGRALVFYTMTPFIYPGAIVDAHEAYWMSFAIANMLLEMGYDVDLTDWDTAELRPSRRDYDLVFDIHGNLERLAPELPASCKKILHLTTSYWEFNNTQAEERSRDLERRRGMYIAPARLLTPSNGIEIGDHTSLIGNSFTLGTYPVGYRSAICALPQSVACTQSFYQRDMVMVAKNFVWVGGSGLVHKGLDLLLDVFKELPDYTLSIFGPVQSDPAFVALYEKELFHLPNITCYGKVDLQGGVFQKVARNSLGMVYPSCAEGSSGAVVNCMHQGLIPLVSRESGVDVPVAESILRSSSVECIREAVLRVSMLSPQELSDWSHETWKYASTHYTRPVFLERYREFLTSAINT